jgi:hypothetical protein
MAGLLLIGVMVLLDHSAATLIGYDPGRIDMIHRMEQGVHLCSLEQVSFPDYHFADIPSQGWNRVTVITGSRRKRRYRPSGPIQVIPNTVMLWRLCYQLPIPGCPYDTYPK